MQDIYEYLWINFYMYFQFFIKHLYISRSQYNYIILQYIKHL